MLLAERRWAPTPLRTPRLVGRCLLAVSLRAPGQPTAAGRCSLEPVTSSRSAQRRPQAQENPQLQVRQSFGRCCVSRRHYRPEVVLPGAATLYLTGVRRRRSSCPAATAACRGRRRRWPPSRGRSPSCRRAASRGRSSGAAPSTPRAHRACRTRADTDRCVAPMNTQAVPVVTAGRRDLANPSRSASRRLKPMSRRSPSVVRQAIAPVSALTATSSPHGGATHGCPAARERTAATSSTAPRPAR